MANIFENQEKKKERKKRLTIFGFYGPVLYLFALLASTGEVLYSPCFFNVFCVNKDATVFLLAIPIYLYFLSFALIITYTYLGLEKLVRRKNHISLFRFILILLPLLFSFIIWLKEPFLTGKHYFFIGLFGVFSIAGLLLIEFRKK